MGSIGFDFTADEDSKGVAVGFGQGRKELDFDLSRLNLTIRASSGNPNRGMRASPNKRPTQHVDELRTSSSFEER